MKIDDALFVSYIMFALSFYCGAYYYFCGKDDDDFKH
jgi:hypothetical protein